MEENVKNKKAIAIKYTSDMKAPQVVAKGRGYVAQNIIETAQQSDVTLYKSKELVDELDKIDIGLNIPPYLYEVVAQVLVFVNELEKKEEYKKYVK